MSVTELQAERERLGLAPDGNVHDRPNNNGRSIADRAGDDVEIPEAEQEELFTYEDGRKVTIGQLINRGTRVEYRMTLNSKSFKGGGDMGLLPFNNPNITLVVPAKQGKVVVEPTYDDDGMVESVAIRVNFRPMTAHDVASPEGRALVGMDEA